MFEITRVNIGAVGVAPGEVRIFTDQSYATVTTAGWLNEQQLQPGEILPSDYITMDYAVSGSSPGGTFGIFRPSIAANGQITLTPSVTAGTVTYTSPSEVNAIAAFSTTTGNLVSGAPTITNPLGSIQAGVSGVAGKLIAFPTTASKGKMQFTCADNAANYTIDITNESFGQSTVFAIQDPATANAYLPVAPAALVDGNLVKATAAGKLADLGAALHSVVSTAYGGGGTSNAFTVTGVTASSMIVGAWIVASTNSVSVNKVVASTNTLTVTFSADPGAGTVLNFTYLTATI